MRYENVKRGVFLERPNRFIARVSLEGETVVCHVKNTGRCRELLVPGAAVYLTHCPGANRKTAFDLIAVEKGGQIINMDAQAPNRVIAEWANRWIPDLRELQSEVSVGRSRLDLCAGTERGP